MTKLTDAMAKVMRQVLTDYTQHGGIIRHGERLMTVSEMASPLGGLPAMCFMAEEFWSEWKTHFGTLDLRRDTSAYTGYMLADVISTDPSWGNSLALLTDYVRLSYLPFLPGNGLDWDTTLLFDNFAEWCSQHVPVDPGAPVIETDNPQPG